jgi:hypothetical protein
MQNRIFEIRPETREETVYVVRSYRVDESGKEFDIGEITFNTQERAIAFVKNLITAAKRTTDEGEDDGC